MLFLKKWYIVDYACIFGNFITVPIHVGFDDKNIEHILDHGELVGLFCSLKQLTRFINMISANSFPKLLKYLFLMDENATLTPEQKSICVSQQIQVYNLQQLGEIGVKRPRTIEPLGETEMVSILYTSGSTGVPKGSITSNEQLNRYFVRIYRLFHPLVTLSYAPLSHGMQRIDSFITVGVGGRIGLFAGVNF